MPSNDDIETDQGTECGTCRGDGQYLDRENRFVRPCPECNPDAGIESLSALPDHPNDRLIPGYDSDAHLYVAEKIVEFHNQATGQLHGLIAVASTTVQARGTARDPHTAVNQALKGFPSGDLESFAISVAEADAIDGDIYRGGYYDDSDTETAVYDVELIGADRFYMWGDPADIGEVAPRIIHAGEYDYCGVVTTWTARLQEVDKERLCVERQYMERVLRREATDGD